MVLGISRHLDVEPVAGLGADERHQLVGIAELADLAHARRHVAAQRDDVADAALAVGLEDIADALARGSHARQVRRGLDAFALDLQHGIQRALLGGAAGAEGHRDELGLQRSELRTRVAQLLGALRRLGREEFKAEVAVLHDGGAPPMARRAEKLAWDAGRRQALRRSPSSTLDSAQEITL